MELWIGAEVLSPAYPGHSFYVRVYDNGGFYIRDMRYPVNVGWNEPKCYHVYSISAFKKAVLMGYGAWLESTAQKRGLYDDGFVFTHLDDAPKSWQPTREAPKVTIVDATGQPLRTNPMPQVNAVH
jgi:hypothetical protein